MDPGLAACTRQGVHVHETCAGCGSSRREQRFVISTASTRGALADRWYQYGVLVHTVHAGPYLVSGRCLICGHQVVHAADQHNKRSVVTSSQFGGASRARVARSRSPKIMKMHPA